MLSVILIEALQRTRTHSTHEIDIISNDLILWPKWHYATPVPLIWLQTVQTGTRLRLQKKETLASMADTMPSGQLEVGWDNDRVSLKALRPCLWYGATKRPGWSCLWVMTTKVHGSRTEAQIGFVWYFLMAALKLCSDCQEALLGSQSMGWMTTEHEMATVSSV